MAIRKKSHHALTVQRRCVLTCAACCRWPWFFATVRHRVRGTAKSAAGTSEKSARAVKRVSLVNEHMALRELQDGRERPNGHREHGTEPHREPQALGLNSVAKLGVVAAKFGDIVAKFADGATKLGLGNTSTKLG